MITPGKVRELYHPDWVSRDATLHAPIRPIALAEGLRQTLAWYRSGLVAASAAGSIEGRLTRSGG